MSIVNKDKFGLYSQRDPRWARETLGNTPYTIKEWGCTITSICMMFEDLGVIMNPSQVAKRFKFDNQGRLIWKSSEIDLPKRKKIKFTGRFYQSPIQKIVREYVNNPDAGMLLEINGGSHWVYLKKWTVFNRFWYLCADPLQLPAKIVKMPKWKITGYATFQLINI